MKIFEDLIVLECAQFISGPWSTIFFADQGATVIKVEALPYGEAFRMFALYDNTMFPLFSILNRGKKSISLDLRKKEGQEVFRDLVKKADVVVENFVKGTMEKWGLGYEDLKDINPGIIYAKISGFGNEGLEEYTKKTAFDIIVQAEAAILDALGLKEGPPKLPIADYTAGHVAAIGISQALYHRERTGEGQFIDISMHDLMFSINIRAQAREFMATAKNMDLGTKFLPIYNQYHTKNGLIALTTITENQFKRLCREIINKPEMIDDPRFNNPIVRFNHVELLDELIENWAGERTSEEALKALESQRIPCGNSLTMYNVQDHPNLEARDMLCTDFDFSKWGVKKASIPNRLINFSNTKGSVESIGPEFGSNNEEVYSGMLGYKKEKLRILRKKKVI